MKTLLLALFYLFISGLANAQSLSVEMVAGPTMAYRVLGEAPQLFKGEGPVLSYDAGLRLLFPWNGQWEFGTGLSYSRKGYNWGPVSFTNEFADVIDVRKYFPSTYSFIELPVLARYYLNENDQYKLYFQTGLSASVFLRHQMDGITYTDSPAIPFNVGLQAGAGILFPLRKSWHIGAEPVLNTQLLPAHGDTPVKKWLFTFGINLVVNRGW